MQGSLSVERMCRVAGVSRASFYRWLEPSPPVEQEVEVRAAIQAIVLEHRGRYGYRRVTRELRDRGCLVNHKRVARLMSGSVMAQDPKPRMRRVLSNIEIEHKSDAEATVESRWIQRIDAWHRAVSHGRARLPAGGRARRSDQSGGQPDRRCEQGVPGAHRFLCALSRSQV